MAHKTLIGGTTYKIKGGRDLIGGTGYAKKNGKALINGTAYDIPLSKGVLLNTITPGAILMLNESGSPVPFYIAKHDYESGLNGAGRTLLVRKDCYDMRVFGAGNALYPYGSLSSWLCNTYIKLLDTDIQAAIGTTQFYCTSGFGLSTVTAFQRAVFQLSLTELGKTASGARTEGAALPIASTLQIAHLNGSAAVQWTRTLNTDFATKAFFVSGNGSVGSEYVEYYSYGSRPAFTLPGTLTLAQNADGTYSIAA